MNIKITALATTLFALSMTACAKSETYTVDFLKENATKRAEVLAACKENKQSDENCKNANEAEQAVKSKELQKKLLK